MGEILLFEAEALQSNRQRICEQLQIKSDFPIKVEIYAPQEEFDEQVMNPDYPGYYAISGSRKVYSF